MNEPIPGMLTIIIPSYNEAENIKNTAAAVRDTMEKAGIPYEILFIDDGSKDATWDAIEAECAECNHTRGVSFSRNFGKEAAIFAGLENSDGDCCVVMDCDLQHPPEKIIEMYRLWEEGYEVIEGIKSDRGKESALHSACARLFYDAMSRASGIDMRHASDFKLMDRKAVESITKMNEKHAFFRALSSWVGFKTTAVEFDVQERTAGTSKWSTWSLVRYAINNISSFTAAPMQAVTFIGVLMLIVSLFFGTFSLYRKIAGEALEGFTTVILLQLFSASVILIALGVIGYYIAKIYEELKSRPRYIISKKCR